MVLNNEERLICGPWLQERVNREVLGRWEWSDAREGKITFLKPFESAGNLGLLFPVI